jgi:hypothetical protein
VWRARAASSFLLSAAWTVSQEGGTRLLVATTDHGRLLLSNNLLARAGAGALSREARMRAGALSQFRASGTATAAWGLHVADGDATAAFCGADGELVAAQLRLPVHHKVGAQRVTLAGIAVQRADVAAAQAGAAAAAAAAAAPAAAPPTPGVVLRLSGGSATATVMGVADAETGVDVLAGALQPRLQALHRCRWRAGGGASDDAARPLACVGAAGVLRVLRVRLPPRGADA